MDYYSKFIVEPLREFIGWIVVFLPNILAAVLILIVGLFAGWLTKIILKKVFTLFRLDDYAERAGTMKILQKSGLNDPFSVLLAKVAGGFVVFAFFVAAVRTLRIEVIQGLTERLFNFLPNAFVGLIIIGIGFILGNFFGRAALIASVNAGIRVAGLVGRSVKYLIILVSVSMALELLGIGRDTVLISYSIILSGLVLALAISFGMGGKDAAKDFIEKKFKGEKNEDEFKHL